MKIKTVMATSIVIFAILITPMPVAWGMDLLSDQQMDSVTAGSNGVGESSDGILTKIPFKYTSPNRRVDGEVLFMHHTTVNQTGILTLMDNAQSNLSSLVNVNAVNSQVHVLLNLNININSTIGNIGQWNSLTPGR